MLDIECTSSTVIPIIWGIVAILFTDEPGSVLSESAVDKIGNICLLHKEKGTPENDRLGDLYKARCARSDFIYLTYPLCNLFFMNNSDDRHIMHNA